jgi:MoxR-like ATPase
VAAAAAGVRLGNEAQAALTALRPWLVAQQLVVSDRRWRRWVALMRVAAACEGRHEVDLLDLWLTPYVAAASPEDVPQVAQWFEAECLQAVPQQAPWLTRAVEAFERQLQIEEAAPADGGAGEETAGKAALVRAVGGGPGLQAEGGPLRVVARALEDRQRRRYSPVHVAARLAQIDEIAAQARGHRADAASRGADLQQRLAGRLLLPPALAARWLEAHAQTLAVLDTLLARLQAVRDGFAALPVDDQTGADPPAPVPLQPQPQPQPE